MREFIDVTGKTEDEAVSKALAQLGLDRDDVSVEILERAKSGFLGIGSSPARVRVYHGPEEEPAPAAKEAPAAKAELRPEYKAESRPEPKQEPRQPRREKPRRQEHREDRPAAPKAEEPRPAPVLQDLGDEVDDEKAQAIRTFLTGLLEHMECSANIRVYQPEKGRYKVILEGEKLGALIGRRGETLDAIQQLTGYAVNKGRSHRVRIHVDAEGYRARREESLNRLARKTAGKVVKYRRNITLEAMNAYERHVIHTALQDYPGVSTFSTGTEPNRRTVVAYDPGKK